MVGSYRGDNYTVSANVGIDFQDLVEQTRTHFVVRNWRTINRQLKELEDHRLLQQRVGEVLRARPQIRARIGRQRKILAARVGVQSGCTCT